MIQRRTILLVSGLLFIITLVYFVSIYFDPIVNYYGVRVRESQLKSLLLARTPNDPDFGLYCIAQPLTNLSEQSICFDSEVEFQQFNQRRIEVEQQLRG